MARKQESILDILAIFPWWVSVCVAGAVYVGLKFIVPTIAFENSVLASLAPAAPQFAWIAAVIFLIPAIESVLKPSSKKKQYRRKNGTKFVRPFSMLAISSRLRSFNREVIRHRESKEKMSFETYTCSSCNALVPEGADFCSKCGEAFDGFEDEEQKEQVDLSAETLKKIEWYSFELFCKIYYENIGYRVVKTKAGADGGMDLVLYRSDSESPYVLVQCKARTNWDIGIKYVRELLGVMTAEKVEKGILITNSFITGEAIEFAKKHQIETIDLYKLSSLVNKLEAEKQLNLVKFLESNDYITPTCPNCETKLVERTTKKGKFIGQRFWGCRNYPRCNYTLQMH